MKVRLTMLLLALALGAFVAAGCGGDDDEGGDTGATAPTTTEQTTEATETQTEESGGSGGGTELKIAADPGGALKFDKDTLEAAAGEVTIVMDNPSALPHAVEIEDAPGGEAEGETVGEGETSTAKAELEAGEYEYYCPVPGHREGGMTGTLTVK
jgi:plastocyanin